MLDNRGNYKVTVVTTGIEQQPQVLTRSMTMMEEVVVAAAVQQLCPSLCPVFAGSNSDCLRDKQGKVNYETASTLPFPFVCTAAFPSKVFSGEMGGDEAGE